jgi:uncharacterized Fe-S cluster protein YjdI
VTRERIVATRDYVGPGITVHWDSERCIHSERCTTGAPTVFDRGARPWVDLRGADAAEVASVIDRCPSGALTYTRTDGAPHGRRGWRADEDPATALATDPEASAAAGDTSAASVTITPTRNGPLVVTGPVRLTRPDGTVDVAPRLVLCRCGQSGDKPRCDGSHARVGFVAPGVAP